MVSEFYFFFLHISTYLNLWSIFEKMCCLSGRSVWTTTQISGTTKLMLMIFCKVIVEVFLLVSFKGTYLLPTTSRSGDKALARDIYFFSYVEISQGRFDQVRTHVRNVLCHKLIKFCQNRICVKSVFTKNQKLKL